MSKKLNKLNSDAPASIEPVWSVADYAAMPRTKNALETDDTIGHDDRVNRVVQVTGLDKETAEAAIGSYLAAIHTDLSDGRRVSVPNVGELQVRVFSRYTKWIFSEVRELVIAKLDSKLDVQVAANIKSNFTVEEARWLGKERKSRYIAELERRAKNKVLGKKHRIPKSKGESA
jgi:hypothetical protein